MFIHRNRGRNAQAVSLGLLAAALISTVVSAADTPDAFVLVAYSNRAGGTQIANGEYLSATQAQPRRACRRTLAPWPPTTAWRSR